MKALLIFCEGKCDVALLNIILTNSLIGCEKEKIGSYRYPSPFDQINIETFKRIYLGKFKNSSDVDNNFSNENKLVARHLYKYAYENTYDYILVYDIGGQNKTDSVANYIKHVNSFLGKGASNFGNVNEEDKDRITDFRFLFVFDKDYYSIDERIDYWKTEFIKKIDLNILNKYSKLKDDSCVIGNYSMFVFGKKDFTYSSIEDIFLDVAKENPFFSKIEEANSFIEKCWHNEFESKKTEIEKNNKNKQIKCSEHINRNKMKLTIAAQYNKPGRGLSAIVEYLIKIKDKKPPLPDALNALNNNESVKSIKALINEILGRLH